MVLEDEETLAVLLDWDTDETAKYNTSFFSSGEKLFIRQIDIPLLLSEAILGKEFEFFKAAGLYRIIWLWTRQKVGGFAQRIILIVEKQD